MNREQAIFRHEHFESRIQRKFLTDNTLARNAFRLRHYAGYVTYTIDGFLDKNRDTLTFVCLFIALMMGRGITHPIFLRICLR